MIIGGVLCILTGVLIVYWMIKHPEEEHEYTGVVNLKGYGAGIGFIIIGIVMLVDALG